LGIDPKVEQERIVQEQTPQGLPQGMPEGIEGIDPNAPLPEGIELQV